MNNPLHHLEDHPSYQLHRRQMWTQILLPILIAIIVFIAIIVITSLSAIQGSGDINRWAAISTMWLILPVMIVGLVFLVLLIALIYLIARITTLIPPYSYQAQQIVYRIEASVKHIALMFRKPVLALQELTKLVRVYIDNVKKTNSG